MVKKINFGIQWHITDICNLQCKHCYREDKINDLSLDENKKIFDNFIRLIEKNGDKLDISFTGGEALVYPHFEELIEYVRKSPFVDDIHIMTNGTYLNANHIVLFKKYGIKAVQISLDGTKEIHEYIRGKGSFDKAVEALKLLHENGFITQVHLVLSKLNYKCVFELIDYLDNLGIVDGFLASLLVPVGKGMELASELISKEEWKDYQNEVEKRTREKRYKNLIIYKGRPTWNLICEEYGSSCPAGINGFDILPNGDVMACRRMNKVIGNLQNQSIFKIWYDCDDIWKMRDKDLLQGKCGNCSMRLKCGGCRALAYSINEDIMAEDPYCWKADRD